MTGIVIDTNVLVHSCNPENEFFGSSIELIELMRNSDFFLCVDEGLSIIEARNSSRIWSEYNAHIPISSLATELLTELLINGRVTDFPTKVPVQILKKINQSITDNTDRIFVKVAYNAECDSLVSHDYVAFPDRVRSELRKDGIANIVNCEGNTGLQQMP